MNMRTLGLIIVALLAIALLAACSGGEDEPFKQPDGLKVGAMRNISVARIEGNPGCLAVYSNVGRSSEYTYRGKACDSQELFDLILREWPAP